MWKEAFKNSSIVLFGVILSRFFVFFYNMLIIRELSVADYALFAFAMAVFNWVLVFSHFDLYAAVSRYVSRSMALGKMEHAWSYYRHASIMAGFFALLGIVVALLIANRRGYPFFVLVVFFTGLLPMALLTVNDGYLKGLEKFGYSALVEITGGLSKLVVLGLALLIMGTVELSDVMMLFLLASLLMFTVSNICIHRVKVNVTSKAIRFKTATAGALFSYSKWVCFTDLMNTGILLSGNLILSYHNYKDLALFNVVILIYSIFQIGFGAITTVLIPQVSRRSANNEVVRLLGLREFVLVALTTSALIVGLLSFPWRQELLLLLFNKPEYKDAFVYLAILLLAFPFRLLTMTNKGIVQGIGQPKRIAYASLVTLITHTLLFIPFYQLFALTGAMIAMVCAYLVEFVMTWVATRKALAQQSLPRSVVDNTPV